MWDPTVYCHNRDRLLKAEIAGRFFETVLGQARKQGLLSAEHFSVDGTLIEAWASDKSFQPKDGPPSGPVGRNEEADFRGQKRSNATHASVTDPDARRYRKSNNVAAVLCYLGHLLMENRSDLLVVALSLSSSLRRLLDAPPPRRQSPRQKDQYSLYSRMLPSADSASIYTAETRPLLC